jgi:hypothetical protein
MRNFDRRLSRLEERFAARVDKNGLRPADVLRERERRWRIAEGEEPEEEGPNESVNYTRCRTIAEILQLPFRQRGLEKAALTGAPRR